MSVGFLQSCVNEKAVQDRAEEALNNRDFKTAYEEIMTLSDSRILKSDSLMMLLSAAYYGLLQDKQPKKTYLGRNVYDVDIIKGRRLLIATDFENEKLKVLSYPEKKNIESIDLPSKAYSVDVSPDESKIAVALLNGDIMIYDLDTKKSEFLTGAHSNKVRGVAFKDNNTLISCSNDQSVVAWNMAEKKPVWKQHIHSRNIKNLRLNGDKSRIITASNDGSSCILYSDSASSGKELIRLPHGYQYVNDAAMSGDNAFAVTVSGDGTIKKWDASTGGELKRTWLKESLCSVDISSDNSLVIVGGEKDVFVLDSETLTPFFKIPGDNTPFWTVKFTDHNNLLVANTSSFKEYVLPSKEELIQRARKLKGSK